jgi:hypothetical protein
MIMNKELKQLADKKFSVYVGGEFERTTGFLGVVKLLVNYSDFFRYTNYESIESVKKWMKDKEIYIDADITVKFK